MIIGIVGSEAAKFTPETEKAARAAIRVLLMHPDVTGFSSGHCHLGGIDIWAEEEADAVDKVKEFFHPLDRYIFPPKNFQWSTGYKPRNIQIAKASDVVHCITVKSLPPTYKGMRFEQCYHCGTIAHIKSGGCWTVKYAKKLGKPGFVHVI